jgi:hypothetical protein
MQMKKLVETTSPLNVFSREEARKRTLLDNFAKIPAFPNGLQLGQFVGRRGTTHTPRRSPTRVCEQGCPNLGQGWFSESTDSLARTQASHSNSDKSRGQRQTMKILANSF